MSTAQIFNWWDQFSQVLQIHQFLAFWVARSNCSNPKWRPKLLISGVSQHFIVVICHSPLSRVFSAFKFAQCCVCWFFFRKIADLRYYISTCYLASVRCGINTIQRNCFASPFLLCKHGNKMAFNTVNDSLHRSRNFSTKTRALHERPPAYLLIKLCLLAALPH